MIIIALGSLPDQSSEMPLSNTESTRNHAQQPNIANITNEILNSISLDELAEM